MSRRSFLERIAALVGMGIAAPTLRVSTNDLPVTHSFLPIDYSNPWDRIEFAVCLTI